MASAFLPNEMTRSPEQWAHLARRDPVLFRLASTFSTPYLVKQWWFLLLPSFLFLSTLTCTVTRLLRWRRGKQTEFSKERSFSFALEGVSPAGCRELGDRAVRLLRERRWESRKSGEGEAATLAGEKGIALGFWGSLLFHAGLICCFLAIPLSAWMTFRGNLVLTEGAVLQLREATRPDPGSDPRALPEATVSVSQLRGVYAEGRFKRDFGGNLHLERGAESARLPFSVNGAATWQGFQFSLQQYGFAPRVVVEQGGEPFDYFLNLDHPEEGDYFSLPDGKRLYVLLLPDFFREGSRIGSRSKEPRNPRLLVRIYRGDRPVLERLLKVGERIQGEGIAVSAPELRNWVSLSVSRERGLPMVILGSLVVTLGLLVRFLSNERRLEVEIFPVTEGSRCRLKGYSRYYPAFLEKEVSEFFEKLKEER